MKRRTFFIGTVGAVGSMVCASEAVASGRAGLSGTVDMEAVVKAAQIDPRRAGTGVTAGAKDSVLLVEQALVAEGFLDASWVDGSFGTRTVGAYSAYQHSLGHSGLAANGLPGRASLEKLGQGRFTLARSLVPGSRVMFGGVTVNERTRAMLREAQKKSGHTLVLDQGSYNPGGDPTSAGTHDGGGAVDIDARPLPATGREELVRALRVVGFAAWLRTPSQADWPLHIHAVAISDTDLSTQAQHQVGDYYLGLNGLAGRGKDDGPRITIKTWEEYQRTR